MHCKVPKEREISMRDAAPMREHVQANLPNQRKKTTTEKKIEKKSEQNVCAKQ
jgi:hypothetical protein